jgi:putative redox protein
MAADEMKVDPGSIDIVVSDAKAGDLPHRFASFEATVHLDDIEDRDIAARLLSQAKQICTVSNTLNAEVSVVLGVKGEK